MLYWFRTPPGVRVGRAALDEEAIRLIEAHHPELRFDWPQILKGEGDGSPAEAARGGRNANAQGAGGPPAPRRPVTNGEAASHGRPAGREGGARRRKRRGGAPRPERGAAQAGGDAAAPAPPAPEAPPASDPSTTD